MKFQATLQLNGKTATGIEVPPEIVEALGTGKRPAVTVLFGSYSYRSTVAPMGGKFYLPVSAEHRTAAGIAAGDAIEVELALDTAPREVEIPDDFAAALAGDAAAKGFFDSLSYSDRRRHVLAIAEAKTPETRQRRIVKAMELLRAGKK
jgi:hypothetical protein